MSPIRKRERPLVYGYLCVEEPDEAQISEWRKDIAVFCTVSGYHLGSIFVDRGVSLSRLARGAFIELLTALQAPEAHAVVVPTIDHLSTETFVEEALTRMVQQTNSRLLVVGPVNGASAPMEGGRDLGSAPGDSP